MSRLRPASSPLVLALVALFGASDAHAVCAEAYGPRELTVALDRAEAALLEADVGEASQKLNEVGRRILCLEQAVDRRDLARLGRSMALLSFMSQDEFGVVRYGLLARYADPDLPWPEGIEATHPFREIIEKAPPPLIGGPDAALALPRGGVFYMDGVPKTDARAPAEVPHLVQVFDKSGARVDSYWQDGAAFPNRYIGGLPGGSEPGAGAGFSLEPPTLAGGGLVLGAAALYVGAAISASKMDKATSAAELTRIRSTTNALVLSSGVLAASGAGLVAFGVLVDGGPGIVVRARF